MGDLETLRTAQVAVALCVLLLLTLGTYRPTRSAFAAWWIGVVGASGIGTAIYEVGENLPTAVFGNGVSVLGASFAWGATRSLRGLSVRWWFFAIPAVATSLATWWEQPQGDAWPAGVSLLLGMGTMLGLSAAELVAEHRANARRVPLDRRREAGSAIATLMVASAFATAFYVLRIVVFLTMGPDSDFYNRWVGPCTTTFLIMLLLVVVSYTVTALSHYETMRVWRAKAITDDLTGLLQRSAFLDRTDEVRQNRAGRWGTATVIVADIDDFKSVNDVQGHAYGDVVLVSFARAIQTVLTSSGIAARFGGDEFVVFLADAGVDEAVALTHAINEAFGGVAELAPRVPTVSYGVASVQEYKSLEGTIHLADRALYQAKREGRARVVAHKDESA